MNRPLLSHGRRARGFSLVELLLAIFILGIGVISVAAVFPAGIALQRQSNDDTLGPLVANHAMAILRSRLGQEDFGSFSQHAPSPYFVAAASGAPIFTVEGDWPWMRPGFLFDLPATSADEGLIDVFSLVQTRQALGLPALPGTNQLLPLSKATEFPDGWSGSPLRGIPFNGSLDPSVPGGRFTVTQQTDDSFTRARPEPLVLISQRERSWPMGTSLSGGAAATRPEYFWEVMFRRFQGRVWVAVFVYRVSFPGGQPRPYSVAPGDPSLNSFDCPISPDRSPLPVVLFTPSAAATAWIAPATGNDPSAIPGTTAGSTLDLSRPRQMWQVPGQWILDQNNFVHRVLNGRRNAAEGPVRFARPIPAAPPTAVYGVRPNANPSVLDSEGVAAAWYLPIRDSRGATLTPVYILVEEL